MLLTRSGSLVALCIILSQCTTPRPLSVSPPSTPRVETRPAATSASMPTKDVLDQLNASLDRA